MNNSFDSDADKPRDPNQPETDQNLTHQQSNAESMPGGDDQVQAHEAQRFTTSRPPAPSQPSAAPQPGLSQRYDHDSAPSQNLPQSQNYPSTQQYFQRPPSAPAASSTPPSALGPETSQRNSHGSAQNPSYSYAPYRSGSNAQADQQRPTSGFAQATLPNSGYQHSYIQVPSQKNQKKQRGAWKLFTGIAIGALLGGVVGGGVGAFVAANSNHSTAVSSPGNTGEIKLKNTETATAVSAIAAARTQGVVTLQVTGAHSEGSGSGVIYSSDGYIVTNAHVVTLGEKPSDRTQIRVRMNNGEIHQATLVGTDPYADIAVVKIDVEGLPAVKLADSDSVNVGDLTVAIGAPLQLSSTVTSGVISAVNGGGR